MTGSWPSGRLFTLVFGLAYAAAVYINYPLFRYYPLVDRFSMRDLANSSLGPAMAYYGWISIAVIPAIILAAITPRRIAERIPPALLWIVPVLMLLAGWYRERSWFL
jgi:hypothetical protein